MNQEEANKLLLEAAESGCLEDIKKALDTGADINYHDPEYCGGTALCYARHVGECVKYLLAHGADVHARNNVGATSLHYAAMSYDSSAFLSLLNAGADIDAKDDKGRTQLYYAAAYHCWEILNIYIEKFGYAINAPYENGETLLHIAVKGEFNDDYDLCSIKELIDLGADVNKQDNDGNTPLHLAVKGECLEWRFELCGWTSEERVFRYYHKNNDDKYTPSYGDSDVYVINLLHSGGANIDIKNNDGKTPLDIALDNNNRAVVNLLKSPPFVTDTHADSLLVKGAYMGNIDLMKAAIWGCETLICNDEPHGADINTKDEGLGAPLMYAICSPLAEHLREDSIKFLISHGADINVKYDDRYPLHKILSDSEYFPAQEGLLSDDTPLHMVLWKGVDTIKLCRLLVDAGAKVNVKNYNGNTPLHDALWMEIPTETIIEICRLLIDAGADMYAENLYGVTPYDIASGNEKLHDIAELMRQKLAGNTPLHMAVMGKCIEKGVRAIELLIEQGADIHIKNNEGHSPLDLAIINKKQSIVDLLNAPRFEGYVDDADSLLLKGAYMGNLDLMKEAIENYAHIDVRDFENQTPLMYAACSPQTKQLREESIKFLIAHGADVNVTDGYFNETLLHNVLEDNVYFSAESCKALINAGADVNAVNGDGNTPLHYALWREEDVTELCSFLIDVGANVNARNNDGNTPLHYALWREDPVDALELCRLLMDAGADMYVENDNGDTPYDIATSDDDLSDIAELMRQKKAAEVNRLIRREPMYQNKVYTLKQLLDWAETGQIAIPNIQRPYVWSPAQLARYVDSLMHGWPCGTLLLWNTDIDNQRIFGTRCFTHLHRLKDAAAPKQEQENTSYTQLILDGQQRLQSLVLAFSARSEGIKATSHEWSRDSGFSRGSSRETERKLLCFNLKNWTQELAEMMPSFYYLDYDENLDDIPCLQWRTEEEISNSGGLLVPLCRIHEYKRTDSVALSWLRGMVDFILEGTQFPVLEVNRVDHTVEDMDDDEAIVQIFTRLNTAGTPLTKEQIQAARINSLWDKFQERIENLKDILRQSPYRVPIGDDDIINGYNITLRAWYRESRINKAYSKAMVKQEWDDIWRLFSHYTRECITALQNKDLDFNVEYKSLYIIWFPVAHLCCADAAQNEGKRLPISDMLASRLEKWVLVTTWAKIWANRSGQYVKTYTDRLVDRDESEATETWLNGILQEESLRKSACDSIDNLAANHRGSVRQYYLPLWAWSRLTEERAKYVLSFGDKPFAIDHIFPVARITDANVKAAYNSLGNCWLLCSDANTKKSDNLFPDFLRSYNTEIKDSIEPLLCTDSFLSAQEASAEYQNFLACREKEIKASIKNFINDATGILYHPDATDIQYRTYQHNTDGIHRGQDYINMEDFKKLKFKSQQSYLSNIRTGLKDLGISESIANMSTEELREYARKDLKSLISSKGDYVRRYLQFLLGTDLDGGGRQRNKKVTQPKCEDAAGKCQANKNIQFERPADALPIGQLANRVVRSMLEGGCCGEDELQRLLDAYYSKQVFKLNYPFLTTGSIQDANGRNRYYASALRIYGRVYYLCSQWVESSHRSRLEQWIKEHQK